MHGLEEQIGGADTAPACLPVMKSSEHKEAFGSKRLDLLSAEAEDSLRAGGGGRSVRVLRGPNFDLRPYDWVVGRVKHLPLQPRWQAGDRPEPKSRSEEHT